MQILQWVNGLFVGKKYKSCKNRLSVENMFSISELKLIFDTFCEAKIINVVQLFVDYKRERGFIKNMMNYYFF